jgi:hypothetical protein
VKGDIDAGVELRALGLEAARHLFLHLQKAASRSRAFRPYWKGGAFATYRGRLVHRRDHGAGFILYVVETESDGGLRVTLIYAGLAASFVDDEAILNMVTPRLKDFFG